MKTNHYSNNTFFLYLKFIDKKIENVIIIKKCIKCKFLMQISQIEEILGYYIYSNILLYGDHHSSFKLTNILKIDMPKIKMLCINNSVKSIYLEKSVNLEVLMIEFGCFSKQNINLLKCNKIKILILNNFPASLDDKHINYLSKFINNLPQSLEIVIINIDIKNNIKNDWSIHNFSYISNLPLFLKYFIIFVTLNSKEYEERKSIINRIKVPYGCKILYSINYIGKKRIKDNMIILDEYIDCN